MTFNEFVTLLDRKSAHHRDMQWRAGQAAFNELYYVRQDLADKVLNTLQDPFFTDEKLPEFMLWLEENW